MYNICVYIYIYIYIYIYMYARAQCCKPELTRVNVHWTIPQNPLDSATGTVAIRWKVLNMH